MWALKFWKIWGKRPRHSHLSILDCPATMYRRICDLEPWFSSSDRSSFSFPDIGTHDLPFAIKSSTNMGCRFFRIILSLIRFHNSILGSIQGPMGISSTDSHVQAALVLVLSLFTEKQKVGIKIVMNWKPWTLSNFRALVRIYTNKDTRCLQTKERHATDLVKSG